jgi:hypothetical protein
MKIVDKKIENLAEKRYLTKKSTNIDSYNNHTYYTNYNSNYDNNNYDRKLINKYNKYINIKFINIIFYIYLYIYML